MGFMKWKDGYSVNVAKVDDQHKKLISLVNQLYDAMQVGKGSTVLGKVLKELVDYTVYHFGTEEEMFRIYSYPEYAEHKKEHDDLTRKAKELKTEFDNGNNLITIEVMRFLSNWLNVHILEVDKKFGIYLNSKGVQ